MSRNELIAKIEALNEWEVMMEEAKTEADAIRSSIKAEMEERGVEELQAGSYIIRFLNTCVGYLHHSYSWTDSVVSAF